MESILQHIFHLKDSTIRDFQLHYSCYRDSILVHLALKGIEPPPWLGLPSQDPSRNERLSEIYARLLSKKSAHSADRTESRSKKPRVAAEGFQGFVLGTDVTISENEEENEPKNEEDREREGMKCRERAEEEKKDEREKYENYQPARPQRKRGSEKGAKGKERKPLKADSTAVPSNFVGRVTRARAKMCQSQKTQVVEETPLDNDQRSNLSSRGLAKVEVAEEAFNGKMQVASSPAPSEALQLCPLDETVAQLQLAVPSEVEENKKKRFSGIASPKNKKSQSPLSSPLCTENKFSLVVSPFQNKMHQNAEEISDAVIKQNRILVDTAEMPSIEFKGLEKINGPDNLQQRLSESKAEEREEAWRLKAAGLANEENSPFAVGFPAESIDSAEPLQPIASVTENESEKSLQELLTVKSCPSRDDDVGLVRQQMEPAGQASESEGKSQMVTRSSPFISSRGKCMSLIKMDAFPAIISIANGSDMKITVPSHLMTMVLGLARSLVIDQQPRIASMPCSRAICSVIEDGNKSGDRLDLNPLLQIQNDIPKNSGGFNEETLDERGENPKNSGSCIEEALDGGREKLLNENENEKCITKKETRKTLDSCTGILSRRQSNSSGIAVAQFESEERMSRSASAFSASGKKSESKIDMEETQGACVTALHVSVASPKVEHLDSEMPVDLEVDPYVKETSGQGRVSAMTFPRLPEAEASSGSRLSGEGIDILRTTLHNTCLPSCSKNSFALRLQPRESNTLNDCALVESVKSLSKAVCKTERQRCLESVMDASVNFYSDTQEQMASLIPEGLNQIGETRYGRLADDKANTVSPLETFSENVPYNIERQYTDHEVMFPEANTRLTHRDCHSEGMISSKDGVEVKSGTFPKQRSLCFHSSKKEDATSFSQTHLHEQLARNLLDEKVKMKMQFKGKFLPHMSGQLHLPYVSLQAPASNFEMADTIDGSPGTIYKFSSTDDSEFSFHKSLHGTNKDSMKCTPLLKGSILDKHLNPPGLYSTDNTNESLEVNKISRSLWNDIGKNSLTENATEANKLCRSFTPVPKSRVLTSIDPNGFHALGSHDSKSYECRENILTASCSNPVLEDFPPVPGNTNVLNNEIKTQSEGVQMDGCFSKYVQADPEHAGCFPIQEESMDEVEGSYCLDSSKFGKDFCSSSKKDAMVSRNVIMEGNSMKQNSALARSVDISSLDRISSNERIHFEKENADPAVRSRVKQGSSVKSKLLRSYTKRGGSSFASSISPTRSNKKFGNIVTNVKSFVPFAQQKQSTSSITTGKREVKVKSLELAEAMKRKEDKKEQERKLRKEAARRGEQERRIMPIEKPKDEPNSVCSNKSISSDVFKKNPAVEGSLKSHPDNPRHMESSTHGVDLKLKRVLEMKTNLEQEKNRKLMEEQRRKEQEWRKKEAELAEKKRKREEEEKRDREEKRKRVEETQRQQKELAEKLRVEKEEKERKRKAIDEMKKATEEEARKQRRLEKEKEAAERRRRLNDDPKHNKNGLTDSRKQGVHTQPIAAACTQKVTSMQTETDGTLGCFGESAQSYDISPYKPSDDEDEADDENSRKFIPLWARKENLIPQLIRQRYIDPDSIFVCTKTCSLNKVFGTKPGKDFHKRGQSGEWRFDKFTPREEYMYKLQMGYIKETDIKDASC